VSKPGGKGVPDTLSHIKEFTRTEESLPGSVDPVDTVDGDETEQKTKILSSLSISPRSCQPDVLTVLQQTHVD
jgi:hypothetical protein